MALLCWRYEITYLYTRLGRMAKYSNGADWAST
jgi:hypothetical protein